MNEKELKSLEKTRNIVHEIVNYGVNDFEIKNIIIKLSREMEDTETMRNICNIFNKDLENNNIESEKPKLEI